MFINEKIILVSKRENWKELFKVEVGESYPSRRNSIVKYLISKRYRKTHELVERDIDIYWIIPLNYLIKVWRFFFYEVWFGLGRYCKRKDWIKFEEGEASSWFWLKHLKIFKKKICL